MTSAVHPPSAAADRSALYRALEDQRPARRAAFKDLAAAYTKLATSAGAEVKGVVRAISKVRVIMQATAAEVSAVQLHTSSGTRARSLLLLTLRGYDRAYASLAGGFSAHDSSSALAAFAQARSRVDKARQDRLQASKALGRKVSL